MADWAQITGPIPPMGPGHSAANKHRIITTLQTTAVNLKIQPTFSSPQCRGFRKPPMSFIQPNRSSSSSLQHGLNGMQMWMKTGTFTEGVSGDNESQRYLISQKHAAISEQGLMGGAGKIVQQAPVVPEISPQHFRDREYNMMVGNLLQAMVDEPEGPRLSPAGLATRAESPALA